MDARFPRAIDFKNDEFMCDLCAHVIDIMLIYPISCPARFPHALDFKNEEFMCELCTYADKNDKCCKGEEGIVKH